jgi:hypothetical protein
MRVDPFFRGVIVNQAIKLVVPILLLVSGGLTGCSSPSDQGFVVGNPNSNTLPEQSEIPFVEIKVTELPPEWPIEVTPPPGAEVDNVINSDDQTTVTWIVPASSPVENTESFVDTLAKAGYNVGESEANQFFGKGAYSNATHIIEFVFTPLTESTDQLYVTYKPLSSTP